MPTSNQLSDFFSYLRFPSISADPQAAPALMDCAEWLNEKFTTLGFSSKVLPTKGHPVVLAKSKFKANQPTILIYGHYDVQPVDPLNLWHQDPFAPYIQGGLVVARGATDNKGQTFAHILGTQQWLETQGELPVNLIYLLEGEEEIGSPHLGEFLQQYREELACACVIVSDTSMVGPGFPAITCGLRGIVCVEVKLKGPQSDLHSGMFGGAIGNPALELAKMLAQLHAPDRSVAIPHFYDEVIPPSEQERSSWHDLPYNESQILLATGAPALTGEEGYTTLERLWTRPTAEVNGLTSGYQGAGSKTIIPQSALAKLSFRLVPRQKPDQIAGLIESFFRQICPAYLNLEFVYDHGGNPYYADPISPFSLAAQAALTEIFGRPPALVREGLSIPIVSLFQREMNCDPLLIGLGLPDCRAHAPNETFPLAQLDFGIALHQSLLHKFSLLPPPLL